MLNFDIGLSGLRVAQRAIELIGTNIVNAGTEGYHRQSLRIVPVEYGTADNVGVGGADIAMVSRSIDQLLEREMLYQRPIQGQVDQELSVLEQIERAMGQVGSQGIATSLDGFFNAMSELAGQPDSLTLRQQVVWAGQELATQLNQMSGYLQDLSETVVADAKTMTGQANSLIEQIALANQEIRMLEMRGANSNILKDQRDQALSELAQMVDLQVSQQGNSAGMVNVSVWGTPVVTGPTFVKLQADVIDNQLGITAQGASQFASQITGGQLGGLAALRNQLISGLQDGLDLLARQVMAGVNAVHAQGLGSSGSFSSLEGQPAGDGDTLLSALQPPITAGTLEVRVTDLATGQASVHGVTIADPSTMTMDQLIAALNAVPGLGVSLSGWTTHLEADTGYTFDFLPTSRADLTVPTWTAGNTADVTAQGVFTGSANQELRVEVEGGGQVGLSDGLSLAVYDSQGNLLRRFNVGVGYAAQDPLSLDNGLRLSLGSGELVAGDRFTLHAQASSDTAGVLAALGINTFFTGRSAGDMTVRPQLLDDPRLVATARGPEASDNANVARMAQLGGAGDAQLGDVSPVDYFAQISSSLGQEIQLRQARQTSLASVAQQLADQGDRASGVDVNDEAAKLILFERMFQASAKFMTTQGKALEYLMNIL